MRNVAMIECIANNIGNIIINSDEITSLNEVCISINNLNLYQKLYNNIINEIYISISESVIHEYHEKKKNGEIFGESTYNRTKYFEENFAEKLEFTYYFLEKYNVLRELLTIRVSDLIKFYKEIILNYNKDKDIIKDILKNNLGEISNIMLNAGDLHNGKAVSIIKLKNGKIVYKPRKIEGEIIVEKFIKYISEYLPKKIIFKFPKYVTRENYTWQEFICQKECVNMDQVHNYYYKTGIYLGIFYLFSTVDIHYENMISHGEDPIFIDLETLVRAETSIDNLNQDRKVDSKSVLISSLIPVKSVGNFFDVNMSALFTGIQKSENIYNTILVPDEKEDWVYMKKQAIVKGQQNILIYNGKEVEPYLVEKDLIQGFKDSMDIVISNKKCFKKLLYKDNNNIKIRQVLRPTHIYWKFIDASHSPVYLSSSEKYNSIFDILYSKFTFGKHGFMRVEKEVEDLKKGNIPLFYTFMGDKNLYADGNLICSDYYIETPLDTIVRKINHLDNELISYQIRLIRMSFLSLYGFDKPVNKIHSEKEREILSKSDIKNILDEYSNYLSKNLIQIDENKYSILSPVIDSEGYIIDGLKSGIYEIGGVIWYLAVYSKLYNSDYSKYAKGMLNTLISQYTKEKMLKKEEMNFSVYGGEGGLLYLVYNFYKIFGEELYLDMTIEIIKDFVKYYNNTNAKCGIDDDFYRGLPGILYVICNIFDNFKLEHNKLICDLNDLVVIGDKLIEL